MNNKLNVYTPQYSLSIQGLFNSIGPEYINTTDTWILPVESDNVLEITGKFLGIGTTQAKQHSVGERLDSVVDHFEEMLNNPQLKCRACRWFEVRLFHSPNIGYFIHYAGRTIIPDESQRCRYTSVRTHYEVIEVLVAQNRRIKPTTNTKQVEKNHGNNRGGKRLTPPVLRMLAQAASFDQDIEDAYLNRITTVD